MFYFFNGWTLFTTPIDTVISKLIKVYVCIGAVVMVWGESTHYLT